MHIKKCQDQEVKEAQEDLNDVEVPPVLKNKFSNGLIRVNLIRYNYKLNL
jgi:hypothetical protein